MNTGERNNKIKNILNSMKGSQKAHPRSALYAKIEHLVFKKDTTILTMKHLKINVAAAVLILVMNTIVLMISNKQYSIIKETPTNLDTYNQHLISTFQIYE